MIQLQVFYYSFFDFLLEQISIEILQLSSIIGVNGAKMADYREFLGYF